MISITLENSHGKQICLTNDENRFQINNVSGLNPPMASISSVENIGDGEEFTHSRISKRNIVISFYINGDSEKNRLTLYQIAQTKEYIKVYIRTDTKSVWADGRIESIETDNFQMKTTCQISIVCFDPYFKSAHEFLNEISKVENNLYFPFFTVEPIPFSTYRDVSVLNLINEGNARGGMTIEIKANGDVINPILYNRKTREYIGVGTEENPFAMIEGDEIVITTGQNNKKIKFIRNAVETNIFNRLIKGSTFLQLESGTNAFTYDTKEGNENLNITIKHYSNFEGV